MKIRITLQLALLVLSVAIGAIAQGNSQSGGAPNARISGDQKVGQQIVNMEQKSRDAMVKGDTSWSQQNLADDFTGIGSMGQVVDKQTAVSDRQSGKLKYQSIEPIDQQVNVLGDTAVFNGHGRVKFMYNGRDMSGEYRVTHVWTKRNGKWQMVSSQSTKIEQPQEASK